MKIFLLSILILSALTNFVLGDVPFRQEPLLYMLLQNFRGGGQDALQNYVFNLGGGEAPPLPYQQRTPWSLCRLQYYKFNIVSSEKRLIPEYQTTINVLYTRIANGVDGLQRTRRWLAAACEQVLQANGSALDAASREVSQAPAGGASSSVSSPKDTADTPPSPRSPRGTPTSMCDFRCPYNFNNEQINNVLILNL